jgi:hypothetical protein
MGNDIDTTLVFRDIGRRKRAPQRWIPCSFPLNDIEIQKQTGELYNYNDTRFDGTSPCAGVS